MFVPTKTNKMKTVDILKTRNEKGVISFSNEVANWYAISRDNVQYIM